VPRSTARRYSRGGRSSPGASGRTSPPPASPSSTIPRTRWPTPPARSTARGSPPAATC
jgi:hypothetical protein